MNMRAFKLRPIAEFLRWRTPSRLGWGALASIPGLALAGPTGENVVAGAAVIHRPSATHTQIDQSTQSAVVNWSTFSIASDEFVIFNQPGATASILNRVIGSQQSRILGQMQANGRVFLVNPQGIYFAPGAKVDVGALTASVLDITNDNFMSGNYVFTRPERAPAGATVENAGEIKVGDGGYVVLAGDYANNTGIITARLGTVVLAAGSRMTLDLSADGLVSFAVDEATVARLAGVNNTGEIVADGGRVIMTAKVANDLVATAVNNDGLLQAHRILDDGGEIFLRAAGGDIVHTGTIDVAGESGQSGGEVGITGDQDIILTAGSGINADGDGAGNGGVVNVIADGTLAFRRDAAITAVAGEDGERGGKVELSGHGGLQLGGSLALGEGGAVVIDPAVMTLISGSYAGPSTMPVGSIETMLDVGTDVTVIAGSSINRSPSATAINAVGFGDLRFQISDANGDINLAGLDIAINGDLNINDATSLGVLTLTTGNVNLGKVAADDVRIFAGRTGGDITLNTGGVEAASDTLILRAPGGSITVGTTVVTGDVSLSGSSALIDIDAGMDVTIHGDVTVVSSYGEASIDIDVGRDLNVFGDLLAVTSSGASGLALISISAGRDLVVGGDMTAVASSDASSFASIDLNAGRDLVIGGDMKASAVSWFASIDISAGRDVVISGNVAATAASNSAEVEIDAGSLLSIRGGAGVIASGTFASIDISAGLDVNVTGDLIATASSIEASIDVSAGRNITLRNVVAGGAASDADISFIASNNIVVNNVTAIGTDSAEIDFSAGNNVTVNALTALAAASEAGISISAGGTVNVNGAVNVSGTSATFFVGGANVNVNGPVNISAASFAAFGVIATNNAQIRGAVNISEAGGGSALAIYEFGNEGEFGKTTVTAGPGGEAEASFGKTDFFGSYGGGLGTALSILFNDVVSVQGGLGGAIEVDVGNTIHTRAAGLLKADQVSLNVSNTGTTTIDVKTQAPLIEVGNEGLTPDVVIDNRAFIGPSRIDFDGDVFKSATFFATGPLTLTGSFVADRLAVGVTAGPVTFDSPVFITGVNPFAPTAPDLALFGIMTQHQLAPPLHGPNVQIFAQNGINMTSPFVVGGPSPFTKMFTNGAFNVSGLTTGADNMLAVFSPIDTTRPIFFEDEPFAQPLGASGFFNFPTIQGLPDTPGVTVVIGEMGPSVPLLSGPLTIGSRGAINLGDRNMFIITRGQFSGENNVATSGIFEIIGVAAASFFEIPIVDEFEGGEEDDDEEDDLALNDGDDAGGDESDVSEESSSESMECSA